MGKVVVGMSMSLDGFVAGPNDGVGRPLGEGGEVLHRWLFSGDRPSRHSDFFRLSRDGPAGSGRRLRSRGRPGGGPPHLRRGGGVGRQPSPGRVPVFVLTHRPPGRVPRGRTPFTFVTGGIEAAIGRARSAAGGKDVGVAGARTAQQAIRAGLVDEMFIHLVPVLLGAGVPLFDGLGAPLVQLQRIQIVEGAGVTHLRFRVVR